jgi:uncharacterized protein (TIGR00255 family)
MRCERGSFWGLVGALGIDEEEMAIHSMTGFGAAQAVVEGWHIKVELKAVNHRGLDARVNTPREWTWVEARALGLLKNKLQRGRITMHIEISRALSGKLSLGIDEEAFGQVVEQLRGLLGRHGLSQELRFSDVLELKGLFTGSSDATQVEDEAAFDAVIAEAIDRFDQTRREEGATIASDLRAHRDALVANLEKVKELRPKLLSDFRERLSERLNELGDLHGVELDQERIIHEVIMFSDRSDIAEELQRAGAHLERLGELLDSEEAPLGKKLDFYLQEMIRETNTMASKSNFSALTDVVVQMKSSIEQMREQAANVE